jgi:hypothetical protein
VTKEGPAPPALGVKVNVASTPALPATRSPDAMLKVTEVTQPAVVVSGGLGAVVVTGGLGTGAVVLGGATAAEAAVDVELGGVVATAVAAAVVPAPAAAAVVVPAAAAMVVPAPAALQVNLCDTKPGGGS